MDNSRTTRMNRLAETETLPPVEKPIAETKPKPKKNTVTVFVKIDDLNGTKTVTGSINSIPFSLPRGEARVVDHSIAEHLLSVGEAIAIG